MEKDIDKKEIFIKAEEINAYRTTADISKIQPDKIDWNDYSGNKTPV